MTDTIADMLTRIRNANQMKYEKVDVIGTKTTNEIARILKPNGVALCFGWNSNGVGKTRGFEMQEVLIVPHGGSRNDTICTVERKVDIERKENDK